MSLKLITPAAALAVSLSEAKAHLRVDGTDEDTLITAMITSATEVAEQITGRAIMPQTWALTMDGFPSVIELTRVPVASITSVIYIDPTETVITLGTGNYRLRNIDDYASALIVPAYGAEWPDTLDDTDTVEVRFVAGYANAAAVPQPIKNWILINVASQYENREETTARQTVSLKFVDTLLDRYKVYQ